MNPEKTDKVIELACELIRGLLKSSIDGACKDAVETFQDDDEAAEPVVKLGVTVEFKPMVESPEVKTKIAWTKKTTAEATGVVDYKQTIIPFSVEVAK